MAASALLVALGAALLVEVARSSVVAAMVLPTIVLTWAFCSAKAPPELRASGCPRVVERMCCWLRLLLLSYRPSSRPSAACSGRVSSACCALHLSSSSSSGRVQMVCVRARSLAERAAGPVALTN